MAIEVCVSKYKDLYTSVSYNSTDMDSLRNDLSAKLAKNEYDEHCVGNSTSVSDASVYVSFFYLLVYLHMSRCQQTWFLVPLYLFLKGEMVSQIRIITEVFH